MKRVKNLIWKIVNKFRTTETISDFWLQKTIIKRVNDREIVFKPYLENKKVLHMGCTDYPVFNPKYNLHLRISEYTAELHGMDVDIKGLEALNEYYPGTYFSQLKDAYNNKYDTILIPETIEHVGNVQSFLEEIDNLKADNFIITGPNAFQNIFKHGTKKNSNIYVEAVHPDHNCWYSPYTLKNVIERYSRLKVNEIYLCLDDRMIVCICSKK